MQGDVVFSTFLSSTREATIAISSQTSGSKTEPTPRTASHKVVRPPTAYGIRHPAIPRAVLHCSAAMASQRSKVMCDHAWA